ncbi:MAG: hypothetical protein IJ804_03715 [Prevotella sp.]|nr:hypothetical protein [Prevotella sp.]
MKKYNQYFLMLLACSSLLMTGCKDDDDNMVDPDGNSSERLFMPIFRLQQNTGYKAEQDPYGCGRASLFDNCPSNHVNDIWLNWSEVEGASAYRIQGQVQGGKWEDTDLLLDTIIPAGQHSFLHEDLGYGVGYHYAIQAISPKGDAYNSKWYGKGDSGHQAEQSRDSNAGSSDANYGALNTGPRYEVPTVFWVTNVTETGIRVNFNTETDATDYSEFIQNGGQVTEDGTNWVFDQIKIEPSSDNADLDAIYYTVTDEDRARGYVDFEGLVSNATYIVDGVNNLVARVNDRTYNRTNIRMHGTVGEPIIIKANQTPLDGDSLLIQAFVPELAGTITRLDTVLINYMGDSNIAEGQVFYLEGGQTYYTQANVSITKGFTLETNPEDLAAGKGRATVLLGVGYTTEDKVAARTNNFMLSRNAQAANENGMMFNIDDVKFNEINFSVQKYFTYTDQTGSDGDATKTISANYFMNMYSQGLSFSLNALSVTNCTFSGMIRGFIRFQGPNLQVIGSMTVDNCVFHDCGNYDSNGRGYAWFAGPGNQRKSNFFQNMTFTNNTIIDCPRHSLIGENGNLAWPNGTKWNINVSNNTFVNYSPRSSSNSHGLVFEIRYAPAGTKVTCKNNLFVWTRKGNDDKRTLYMKGMMIEQRNIEYDFADNYSTYIPETTTHLASDDPNTTRVDGMFTGRPFSDTNYGVGYNGGELNVGGRDASRIKFGDNINGNEDDAVGYQLKAEELFRNPQPLGVEGTKDMHRHNVDGFYYNMSDTRVANHPIVTKKIGDQRWATGAAWH